VSAASHCGDGAACSELASLCPALLKRRAAPRRGESSTGAKLMSQTTLKDAQGSSGSSGHPKVDSQVLTAERELYWAVREGRQWACSGTAVVAVVVVEQIEAGVHSNIARELAQGGWSDNSNGASNRNMSDSSGDNGNSNGNNVTHIAATPGS